MDARRRFRAAARMPALPVLPVLLVLFVLLVLPVPPVPPPSSMTLMAVVMPSWDDRRFGFGFGFGSPPPSPDAAAPDDVVLMREVKRDETTRSAENGSSNMAGSPYPSCPAASAEWVLRSAEAGGGALPPPLLPPPPPPPPSSGTMSSADALMSIRSPSRFICFRAFLLSRLASIFIRRSDSPRLNSRTRSVPENDTRRSASIRLFRRRGCCWDDCPPGCRSPCAPEADETDSSVWSDVLGHGVVSASVAAVPVEARRWAMCCCLCSGRKIGSSCGAGCSRVRSS
mmetsp:Transcript_24262/g.69772  ORF Transcript_24262/g.69772 Transcript_24262/m.69772 type:complete len:285 (-) Transcript_24262:488-1342(-)